MQFNVPQFIEIEDKIFGPLTWKQFLYVGGGFGMALVLLVTNFVLFLIIGVPLAALAGALAFYPVNNRPFSVFLESAVNFFLSDREYFWQSDNSTVYTEKSGDHDRTVVTSQDTNTHGKPKIASLSRKLELEALKKDEMDTASMNITN